MAKTSVSTRTVSSSNAASSRTSSPITGGSLNEYKPLRFGGNKQIEKFLSEEAPHSGSDESGRYKAIELGGGKQVRIYDTGESYGVEVVVPHVATHGKYKGKHDGTFNRVESSEVKTFSKFNKLVNDFKKKYK